MAQPHQGDPAQDTGLDQVAPAGTHRIAVDAQGFDFRATAPFQGFVDAEDQRTIALVQVLGQQHKQDASRLAGQPHRPEVRDDAFPTDKESFSMDEDILAELTVPQ